MPKRLRPLHHRILLHDLPALVDGPAALAATQGNAAPPAAGALAGGLGPLEGFFGILEIVGDHGGKATEQLCHVLSNKKKHSMKGFHPFSSPEAARYICT